MLRGRLILAGVLLYTAGCGSDSPNKSQIKAGKDTVGVIYGDDSVRNVLSSIPNSAISVAFIPKDSYDNFKNKKIAKTVADKEGNIEGLTWIKDPSLAVCSGVLIDKDLVLTAGHCFDGPGPCGDMNVVFGYESSSAAQKKMTSVGCKEVIKDQDDLIDSGLDYALVRLEKAVDFTAAQVSKKEIAVGDDIYTIGYPLGSPKKKATGRIRKIVDEPGVYNSNLDTFAGNSGSPVYLTSTNELIGIVSTGERDFEDSDDLEQRPKVKHCAEDECLGEIIVPIQKVLEDIKK